MNAPVRDVAGSVRILVGDVRERLRELPDDHFDCVVTSPPYWGLRDYGTATWEGGDANCDHRSPTMREGRNEDRQTLGGAAAATNSYQLLLAHEKAICGKCGASKVDAQIGLEPTLGKHLTVMVEVFREVRRVLKPTGTLWLNYGDCYATTPNGRSASDTKAFGNDDRTFRDKPFSTVGPIFQPDHETGSRVGGGANKGNSASDHTGRIVAGGVLKPKDLCMIPNRLAIALQEDGWWVRSEIIWGKPNGMPDSSGRFRPATSHEKIFLLTKDDAEGFWVARDTGEVSPNPDLSERVLMPTSKRKELGPRWIGMGHFYDASAVRIERATESDGKMPDGWDTGDGGHGSHHRNGREKGKPTQNRGRSTHGRHTLGDAIPIEQRRRGHAREHQGFNERWDAMERAEQVAGGRLLRNFEPAPLPVWEIATAPFPEAHFATFPPELAERCIRAGCPAGGTVLDPFGGAGTVAMVADRMGCSPTIIELNPEYAEIARNRLLRDGGMFSSVHVDHRQAAE